MLAAWALAALQAQGFVVVTFDPRTDCLRYEFMGWIRVVEPMDKPSNAMGNAMVRVEVVEALVGPAAGERFDLAYMSFARETEEAAAAKAGGGEEVVSLSSTDYNEYPPGSEWVIFGNRLETGGFTAIHSAHYRVENGRVTERLPPEYLAACSLPERPLVGEVLDGVRRVAPYFRLRASGTFPRVSNDLADAAEKTPGAVWARLFRQRLTSDEPLSSHDVVVLPSSDVPRSRAEWREWFPVEAVWGEAIVDDCAVVLVSVRDTPVKLAIVPLLFVREDARWKWVVSDLHGAQRGDAGLTAVRPELIQTLEFWANREIDRIPVARVQTGPLPGH